ncbi:helix-turn-helix domain-containing protein [Escherichia coli]|uniref:helix-turn-helix domain-containing protein n=1 Tax=Escherichia coli TaxID=562 RepID=UPI003F472211
MTFGENLKAIRKKMKLTQQEMADKMGISQSYLSDMENSRKCPCVNTALLTAKKLNISVNELVNDDTEMVYYSK